VQSSFRGVSGQFIEYHYKTMARTVVTTLNADTTSFTVSGFGSGNKITPTPGQFTKHSSSTWSGKYVDNSVVDPYERVGKQVYPGYSRFPPSYDFTNLQNSAIADLFSKLRSDVDLSIDLFEADKTLKMFKDLGRMVRRVKSIHPNQWAKHWLTYTYGLRPLYGSIYGTFHEMMHPARGGSYIIKGRAIDVVNSKTVSSAPFPTTTDIFVDSRRSEYAVRFTLTKPSALQSLGNYTSLNPASIVWELTPFSFVADWFIDIGGYLRNLETALLYMNNISSIRRTNTRLWNCDSLCVGGSGVVSVNLNARYRYVFKNRSSPALVIPSLPRPKFDLGWRRFVSAGSLLHEHFGLSRPGRK
jgi:hypothetical protein